MPKKPALTQEPDGTIKFSLTIPQKAVAQEYQHVLVEFSKTAEIKGFRKGKAPIAMVEQTTDQSKIISHVLEHVLPSAYSQVIQDHQLKPLVEPQVTPTAMKTGEDWQFTVVTAIAPTFVLGDYRAKLTKALAKHKESKKDERLKVIFDTLLSLGKFSVAPLLVDMETKAALSRLINQLGNLKLTVADYAKSLKKTPEELVAEYQTTATTNLQLHFILQAIQTDQKLADSAATLDFLQAL